MSLNLPDSLLFERRDRIGVITLNRPEAHNALLIEMIVALDDLMREFEIDDSLSVMVITGAGDRAFCSGGDLKKTIPTATGGAPRPKQSDPARRFFSEVTKPIISAINGFALAGGLELVLGTDLRIASETASFGLSEARWALLPAGGGTIRLPRQIPYVRAMEMMLLGDRIDAAQALDFGLVNRVVPPADLMTTALEMAGRVSQNGPLALRKIKETVVKSYGLGWEQAFFLESLAKDVVFASDDAKEGPLAFAEKRSPRFTGH